MKGREEKAKKKNEFKSRPLDHSGKWPSMKRFGLKIFQLENPMSTSDVSISIDFTYRSIFATSLRGHPRYTSQLFFKLSS